MVGTAAFLKGFSTFKTTTATVSTENNQAAARLSNNDILAQLTDDKRSTLWLGRYSENEVLRLLEHFDILPALKAKGCAHPLIIIEPLAAFEQALKIFNAAAAAEKLFAEFRLREVSFSHPRLAAGAPLPMLKIEWLMLQNPAAVFSAERPPMPGQRRPGLGFGKRALQLLVHLARQNHLSGVLNFPEFFHNAFLYLESFWYCNPQLKGIVLALRRDFHQLTLAELSWAIYLGCVIEAQTGKIYEWQADALVLPLDEKIKRCFSPPEYEQAVYQAMADSAFVLNRQKFEKFLLDS